MSRLPQHLVLLYALSCPLLSVACNKYHLIPDSDGGGPPDGSRNATDGFVPYDALPAPSSHAQVPGGVSASSAHYRMVKTTAQSPGGNGTASSTHFRLVGGIVPATQP
jgi:hypothetical protein